VPCSDSDNNKYSFETIIYFSGKYNIGIVDLKDEGVFYQEMKENEESAYMTAVWAWNSWIFGEQDGLVYKIPKINN
jgi:hypothetical protein